ncbi:MAG: hypothetical protein M1834_000105 [Cirrosporium novae-zelandiae]|nr:MAG: hypothetical protein M1834_000105 [Cirrosporium novae-zelandiae]
MAVSGYVLYHYNPSLVAAVIFIALFNLASVAHTIQLIRRRTWYFIPFVIGGCFETVGYIGRAWSAKQSPDWTVPPYVMQSLLLLLAPALFAASIYMVLGRIIQLTDGEEHSLIRAKLLTKVFVTGDVLSFFVQSTGGGMMAQSSGKNLKLGERLITIGLLIQILFFGFFMIVAGVFHYRIALYPTGRCLTLTVPWKRYLWILYSASLLIMVRSVFRVIEYVQGSDGMLLQHELYLYIFDATLMFLTMVIFNIFHPSKIISKYHRVDGTQPAPSRGSGAGSREIMMQDQRGYEYPKP